MTSMQKSPEIVNQYSPTTPSPAELSSAAVAFLAEVACCEFCSPLGICAKHRKISIGVPFDGVNIWLLVDRVEPARADTPGRPQ